MCELIVAMSLEYQVISEWRCDYHVDFIAYAGVIDAKATSFLIINVNQLLRLICRGSFAIVG